MSSDVVSLAHRALALDSEGPDYPKRIRAVARAVMRSTLRLSTVGGTLVHDRRFSVVLDTLAPLVWAELDVRGERDPLDYRSWPRTFEEIESTIVRLEASGAVTGSP